MKEPKSFKPKKCKSCGNSFVPERPLQSICGYQCALDVAKAKSAKKKADDWKKEKKEIKERIKTLADWNDDLQKEVNKIIRLIDKNHPCVSSGRMTGQQQAGHLFSRGAFPALRFHLMNIYGQSAMDNNHKSGNPLEYANRLVELFGQEHYDMILSLKGKYPILKLTVDEIKEKIYIARGIIKWLTLQDRQFTKEERIELRHKYNQELGIYN